MINHRFKEAFDKVNSLEKGYKGIGTLGEKTLHSVLKYYYEPDDKLHEIKIKNFFADIVNHNGIIEIQTRHFNKLCKKLDCFLQDYVVTLVYPIAYNKWLRWIDIESGETTKRRLSPKKGLPYEIFFELYKIKNYLQHKNIRLCIVLLDIEEYRLLNGWSEDRKRGSRRDNRVPIDIQNEIFINNSLDYSKLIPTNLPTQFTSNDFSKASGLNKYNSQTALNVLNSVNAIVRVGKIKNLYLYERSIQTT